MRICTGSSALTAGMTSSTMSFLIFANMESSVGPESSCCVLTTIASIRSGYDRYRIRWSLALESGRRYSIWLPSRRNSANSLGFCGSSPVPMACSYLFRSKRSQHHSLVTGALFLSRAAVDTLIISELCSWIALRHHKNWLQTYIHSWYNQCAQ